MRVDVEGMRRMLEELTGEWSWVLKFTPRPGRQRLQVVARSRTTQKTRSLVIDSELLERLGPQQAAEVACRLLGGDEALVEIECRIASSQQASAEPVSRQQRSYELLCDAYRADLRAVRSQAVCLPLSQPKAPGLLSRIQQRFFAIPRQLL